MWSIALLINTSTWDDFKHNWKIICVVFIQLHVDEKHVNREYQDALLEKIRRIRSDPNTVAGIKASEQGANDNFSDVNHHDVYDFNDDDGHHIAKSDRYFRRPKQTKVDREKHVFLLCRMKWIH